MPVTGVRQPNERVLYDPSTNEPFYARYSYAFEGLDGTSGVPLEPGEIVAACRGAQTSATSTPLPPSDQPLFGMGQTRVDVRRYNRQTGQARIVVEWGTRRSSFGAAPDVVREETRTLEFETVQPYAIVDRPSANAPVALFEEAERTISRGKMRTTIRRLKTDEANIVDTITRDITANIGNLMRWRGELRIIAGGGFTPINQTQGYATIVLDYMAPVAAVGVGQIVNERAVENKPVAALAANQVYKLPPSFSYGTEAEPLNVTYPAEVPTFTWLTS